MNPNRFALRAGGLLVCGLSLWLAPPAARADVSLLFDTNAVTIEPGQTFTFSVRLNATVESTVGVSYYLFSPDVTDRFLIVDRDIAGSAYSELLTDNATVLEPTNALLNPANGSDLGATVADVLTPNSPGDYFLATYRLRALSSLPTGIYTLLPYNALATDDGFNDVAVTTSSLTVTVVPEPGLIGLIGGGAAVGGALLRRRRAGA